MTSTYYVTSILENQSNFKASVLLQGIDKVRNMDEQGFSALND